MFASIIFYAHFDKNVEKLIFGFVIDRKLMRLLKMYVVSLAINI